MIVEMREYVLQVGKAPEYVRLYEEEGFAIQESILGHLIGYFSTEIGQPNQVVQLWAYRDFADRDERRARLAADERWQAYLGRVRPFIISQENRILRPSAVMGLEPRA